MPIQLSPQNLLGFHQSIMFRTLTSMFNIKRWENYHSHGNRVLCHHLWKKCFFCLCLILTKHAMAQWEFGMVWSCGDHNTADNMWGHLVKKTELSVAAASPEYPPSFIHKNMFDDKLDQVSRVTAVTCVPLLCVFQVFGFWSRTRKSCDLVLRLHTGKTLGGGYSKKALSTGHMHSQRMNLTKLAENATENHPIVFMIWWTLGNRCRKPLTRLDLSMQCCRQAIAQPKPTLYFLNEKLQFGRLQKFN